jgi:hypothetical protein
MPEGNGDYRQIIADLVTAARLNLDEHDRIWKSIEKLRDAQLELGEHVKNLVTAVRDLIDRIPPENLR